MILVRSEPLAIGRGITPPLKGGAGGGRPPAHPPVLDLIAGLDAPPAASLPCFVQRNFERKKEGRSSASSIEEVRSSPCPAGAAPAGLGQGPTLAAANAEERPSFFAQNFVARMSEKKFRLFNFFFYDHTRGPMVCTGNEYGRKNIILTPIHLNSTPLFLAFLLSLVLASPLSCLLPVIL